MVKISMGSKLILLVFDKNNKPYNNVEISMKDSSNPSKSVDLLNEKGESLAVPIKTNKEGKVTVFLNKMSYSPPFKVTAVDDFKKIATESIKNIEEGKTNSSAVHFGLAKGTNPIIIIGAFTEFPFNTPIIAINGSINLNFKVNNTDLVSPIILSFNDNQFYNAGEISSYKIIWAGWFNNGNFGFKLIIPNGVLVNDCEVTINHNNQSFTHSSTIPNTIKGYNINQSVPGGKFNLNYPFMQQIVIPFYHSMMDYVFTANLYRFITNLYGPPTEILNKKQYPAILSFEHHYTDASGTKQNIKHILELSDKEIFDTFINEASDLGHIPRDDIIIDFKFNNGNYEFTLKNVVGEIQNGELKINYGTFTLSHLKKNGHPNKKFAFSNTNPIIPFDDSGKNNIIIPLNGWQNNFEIIPNRNLKDPINLINFDGEPAQGIEFTADNKYDFTKLNFKIRKTSSEPQLTYNDSTANIDFLLNIFIADENFNPVKVRFNFGQATKKSKNQLNAPIIHSFDFHANSTGIYTPRLFFPISMDPLPTPIKEPFDNLIKNPGASNETGIDISIDFINSSGNNLPEGTYYVLAQVLPVHYTKQGHDALIDSVGFSKQALFKITITNEAEKNDK
jgi:hypothetical protein